VVVCQSKRGPRRHRNAGLRIVDHGRQNRIEAELPVILRQAAERIDGAGDRDRLRRAEQRHMGVTRRAHLAAADKAAGARPDPFSAMISSLPEGFTSAKQSPPRSRSSPVRTGPTERFRQSRHPPRCRPIAGYRSRLSPPVGAMWRTSRFPQRPPTGPVDGNPAFCPPPDRCPPGNLRVLAATARVGCHSSFGERGVSAETSTPRTGWGLDTRDAEGSLCSYGNRYRNDSRRRLVRNMAFPRPNRRSQAVCHQRISDRHLADFGQLVPKGGGCRSISGDGEAQRVPVFAPTVAQITCQPTQQRPSEPAFRPLFMGDRVRLGHAAHWNRSTGQGWP
jgi:hypothetical protein